MSAISLSTLKNISKNTSNTINDASSGVSDSVSSATNTVSNGITGAEKYASNLLSSGISDTSNYLNKGVSAVESGIGDIADNVSSSISGLFETKSDNQSSNIKNKNSDPLKTSTVKGTPKSNTFTTNSQYAQTQAINLQSKQPSISKTTAGLSTIASRLGGSLSSGENSVMNLAKSVTHNSLVSGMYHTASGAVSTVSSTVKDVRSTVSGVENDISGTISDFTNQYGSFFSGLGDASNTSLSSLIDNGLPGTAGEDGKPIDGIPTNVGSDKLDSLYGAVKGIGCSIKDAPYTKYAAKQSFKGSLLGITSKLNMTDLFRQMTKCSQYQDAPSIKNLAHVFTSQASNNPEIANIASEAINDPSKTPINHDMARSIVTNPNLKQTNVSDVKDMFTRMNIDPQRAYEVETGGSSTVYDNDILKDSPKFLSSSFLGDEVGDIINDKIL